MAELADALDLGSSGVTRTGSIPASRTKKLNTRNKIVLLRAKNNEKRVLICLLASILSRNGGKSWVSNDIDRQYVAFLSLW